MKLWKVAVLCVAVVAVFSFAGCGGPDTVQPDGKPAWVDKAGGAFPGDKDRALYAVGMAGYDPNPRMQDLVAMNTARTELARQMETYVANLIKDFMQSHQDFADPKAASSIQFVQSVSKSVTEATLRGSRRVDSWTDAATKTKYVLVRMDTKDVLAEVPKVASARAREQQAELFKAKTEEALKALDAELEKRREALGE
jgi:hypothetical protein